MRARWHAARWFATTAWLLALASAATPSAAQLRAAAATPHASRTPRHAQATGPTRVLVLLGMPGAGKSTAAQRLAARLGARMWSSGDVIRSTVAERGLPNTAASDRAVAEEFARRPGTIGGLMASEVSRSTAPIAIVEGFRTIADLKAFRRAFPDAVVVSLEVGAERRHARMLDRGRVGEDSRAFLRERDRVEVRRGVRAAMAEADVRLRPRGETLGGLDRSLERLLGKLDPLLARRFRAASEAQAR